MCNYESARFKSRKDAEEVLDILKEINETYGVVYLSDYKDLCDIKSDYMDTKYGWLEYMIKDATICRDYYGYFINLPKPIILPDDRDETPVDDPETSTINIVLHTNEVSDPDAALAEIFKHIQTIKDRMINISIM